MSQNEEKLEIVQKYYIRKKDGEIDYEHPYDFIGRTNCKGLYYVCLNKHIGYMNEKGEFIVPISYDYTRKDYRGYKTYHTSDWHYYDGKTLITDVYKDNRVGVINNRGEEIVTCEFERVNVLPNQTSENFISVAVVYQNDNSKLLWGMYDVKNKKISVVPQYDEIEKEKNGYASFKKNGKWGLLHCASGKVVIPAMYLIEIDVLDNGIARAFLGGSWRYAKGNGGKSIDARDCHILVLNGVEPAQIVVSGYKWIEPSGPSVMKCRSGKMYSSTQEDSFKILKMPNYIGIIKNATYEAGYFLKENGKFVKEWTVGCMTSFQLLHARYVSGGTCFAMTYDGKNIPVTDQMKVEILKHISEEEFQH